MRRSTLIGILCFIIFKQSVAQELSQDGISFEARDSKTEGQIVYKDRTVDVTFYLPTYHQRFSIDRLQEKIEFNDHGVRRFLFPRDAEEIRISWNGGYLRMMSQRPRHCALKKKFILVSIDGDVMYLQYVKRRYPTNYATFHHLVKNQALASERAYRWVPTRSPYQGISYHLYDVYEYLQRNGDETLTVPRRIGFRKQMSHYFNDCSFVRDMIAEKIVNRQDLIDIVSQYNSHECNFRVIK